MECVNICLPTDLREWERKKSSKYPPYDGVSESVMNKAKEKHCMRESKMMKKAKRNTAANASKHKKKWRIFLLFGFYSS